MVQLRLKQPDAWWTVLAIDPLAGPLVRLVAPFKWITPNRLTMLSIVLGASAGVLFAFGHLVAGALVYQVSFLVDCMDGKLAGVRGLRNPWGNFIDQLGDHGRFLFCLCGLAYGTLGGGEAAVWWVVAFAAYACLRFSILVLGDARPGEAVRGHVTAPARPLAILRTAPGRLTKPGTTVDTESLSFTVGPLIGVPLVAIAVAAGISLLHLVVMTASALRAAAASQGSASERSPA